MPDPLDAVEWPARTERLLIRRATPEDLGATWVFRRLPEVNDWLGAATVTYEAYRERYLDPERLARTLVVELERRIIGDLMLRVEDGWAQAEVADQERVGMRREQHGVKDSLHMTKGWLDGVSYGLLAEEWDAARG